MVTVHSREDDSLAQEDQPEMTRRSCGRRAEIFGQVKGAAWTELPARRLCLFVVVVHRPPPLMGKFNTSRLAVEGTDHQVQCDGISSTNSPLHLTTKTSRQGKIGCAVVPKISSQLHQVTGTL